MTTIGYFNQTGNDFTGTIRTLTLEAEIIFEPVTKKTGKSPDYRVYSVYPAAEVGAAWIRSKDGKTYFSVTIDDPSFPAPIICQLIQGETRHLLVWKR